MQRNALVFFPGLASIQLFSAQLFHRKLMKFLLANYFSKNYYPKNRSLELLPSCKTSNPLDRSDSFTFSYDLIHT